MRPWQWITCTFSHAGILHVGMNMLFLWWFGQIVEGRTGPARFLLVYLGIGAAAGFVTQLLTLGGEEGYALGASGVIYGLIVVALVFTPETDVTCIFWFFSWSRVVEMSLKTLGIFYLVVNFLGAAAFRFEIGSEVLHLIGAAAGFGAAYGIRALGWWYEPPEDEVAGDVREEPTVAAPPPEGPVFKPPVREDLPPLELD